MAPGEPRVRFAHSDALEGLRGFAVALVFAVHFCGAFALFAYGINFDTVTDPRSLGPVPLVLYWGFYSHHGVQIFFALSGFVILRSFAPGASFPSYARFLGLRCLRIYPAFLVSVAAGIAYAVWLSGAEGMNVNRVAANLLFLNGVFSLGVAPYNYVTWSLFYEFVFYLSFPLLFVAARRSSDGGRIATPLLWLAFVASLALVSFHEWFFFLPFLLGASAGIQSDEALRRIASRCPPRALLAGYIAITTAAFLWIPLPRWTSSGLIWPATEPVFALALAVVVTLVIVSAAYGRGAMRGGLTFAPLVALGRISFSFFLLHALILHALFTAGHRFVEPTLRSFLGLLVVGFALSCACAWLLYRVAEKPYHDFRRRLSVRRTTMEARQKRLAPASASLGKE
jgi:peptidoglycan/LPS O-acetylase OafA/YrhL